MRCLVEVLASPARVMSWCLPWNSLLERESPTSWHGWGRDQFYIWLDIGGVLDRRVGGAWIDGSAAWLTWTPTFPANGALTFAPTEISHARYTIIGKTCHFVLRVAGTTSGTAGTILQFTPPVPAYLNMNASIGSAVINDAGFDVGWMILGNSTTVQVRKAGANNPWALGADKRFYVSGSYEIA